jgi:hypothetical protein
MTHDRWAMQESRAQRDISASKQRPTQSRSVEPLISDASVPTGAFPTDRRLTVRRAAREKLNPLCVMDIVDIFRNGTTPP